MLTPLHQLMLPHFHHPLQLLLVPHPLAYYPLGLALLLHSSLLLHQVHLL
jgi:hypothetical protein